MYYGKTEVSYFSFPDYGDCISTHTTAYIFSVGPGGDLSEYE